MKLVVTREIGHSATATAETDRLICFGFLKVPAWWSEQRGFSHLIPAFYFFKKTDTEIWVFQLISSSICFPVGTSCQERIDRYLEIVSKIVEKANAFISFGCHFQPGEVVPRISSRQLSNPTVTWKYD